MRELSPKNMKRLNVFLLAEVAASFVIAREFNPFAFKAGARYTVRDQVAGSGGTDSAGTVSLEISPAK